jgi:hypothetical protein
MLGELNRVKRKVTGASFIIALLLSATQLMLVNLATANPAVYLPVIVIKSDGTVEPETQFIKQDGNVYTLTTDLIREYAIVIQCSNIVFDGAGHLIDGSLLGWTVGHANRGLSLEGVTNVTVKDIEVTGFSGGYSESWLADVSAENATNSVFLRVTANVLQLLNSNFGMIESNITDEYTELRLIDSNYNIVFKNTIAFLTLGGEGNIVAKNNITKELNNGGLKNNIIANRINQLNLGSNSTYYANDISKMTISGADNLFYGNNFQGYDLRTTARRTQFWDNGEEGNYWQTYKSFDANDDGISDKPYTIEAKYYDPELKKEVIVVCGIDNYPLMSPFNIESVSFKLPDWAPTSITSAPEPQQSEPFPTALFIIASGASVAVVGIGLLFYFKKRKH